MFVVDTNLLIYAADKDSPEHLKCRNVLESLRSGSMPWYITWRIAYEFCRVVTHPKVLKIPLTPQQAWIFLEALFQSPSMGLLTETDRHRHVAVEVFTAFPEIRGNMVFDAHTAILMKENGVRKLYSRDSDFDIFPFVDRIDPLN